MPSIFVFKGTKPNHQKLSRYERFLTRKTQTKPSEHEHETSSTAHCGEVGDSEQCVSDSVESPSATGTVMVDKGTSCDIQLRDSSVNTDDSYESRQSLLTTIAEQKEKISSLNDSLLISSSPAAAMRNDNEQTLFLTGIPSYDMFEALLNILLPVVKPKFALCAADQFLLVMMKLRLAVPLQDLSYRFRTGMTVVSKIFHKWLDVMSRELKQLIVWPDRGILRETLPECFKPNYTRTTCIIDCSEIFIERPSSLSARSETYSNYKSHNTVKFLVAVSPTGAVIFVSKCWGGRVSDRHLTVHSGFLNKLSHGDLVLADRGFDIADDLALVGASLAIPPFTRGKPQLSQREVETSRALSRVRIHVERAIGRMKNFKILQSTLPIKLIKRPREADYTTIDKILVVCAALCNLYPTLIS